MTPLASSAAIPIGSRVTSSAIAARPLHMSSIQLDLTLSFDSRRGAGNEHHGGNQAGYHDRQQQYQKTPIEREPSSAYVKLHASES